MASILSRPQCANVKIVWPRWQIPLLHSAEHTIMATQNGEQLVNLNIYIIHYIIYINIYIYTSHLHCSHKGWVMRKVFPYHDVIMIVRRAGLLWSQQDFEWRWSVPLFKCLTVLEFSFILFDLCLLITFFNFIMNYVPIVTFWIFTYHKIWILSIMFCFIWSYWIIYFLACLEESWRVVS